MEEEKVNWNFASNTELNEKCTALEKLFSEKQQEMSEHVNSIEKLNDEMIQLSSEYIEIKAILNKREGKTDA